MKKQIKAYAVVYKKDTKTLTGIVPKDEICVIFPQKSLADIYKNKYLTVKEGTFTFKK